MKKPRTVRVADQGTAGGSRRGFAGRWAATTGAVAYRSSEAGMTTAEYAVGTLAACGFAGLLLKVLTSAGMGTLLRHVVERALAVAG